MAKNPKYANAPVDLSQAYKPLNDAIDAAEKAGDVQLAQKIMEREE